MGHANTFTDFNLPIVICISNRSLYFWNNNSISLSPLTTRSYRWAWALLISEIKSLRLRTKQFKT